MKNSFLLIILLGIGIMSCNNNNNNLSNNPFLSEWETPFGTPPFDKNKRRTLSSCI